MPKMLIGESEQAFVKLIREQFLNADFHIDVACSGKEISTKLAQDRYDVVLLAASFADAKSIDVCRQFRQQGGKAPVLIVAESNDLSFRKMVLEAGADDFVFKSTSMSGLSARVHALLRNHTDSQPAVLAAHGIELDRVRGTVSKNGAPLHLFPMEFELLQFFLSHPNQPFSAHALFERLWNNSKQSDTGTVRTYIKTLRRKIDNGSEESLIKTVRGAGYKLRS